MNLFILAAGKGTRLYPLTKNQPKSLIQLNDGSTILERQIEVAQASQVIDTIYIITGYLTHMIEERIAKYQNVEIIYNPYYDVSNNLFSLWTAHYLMLEKDFIVSNGDNIYKPGIYEKITGDATQESIQLTVDSKPDYDDDDMKVMLQPNGSVKQVSKGIPLEQTECESLGLTLIKGSNSRKKFHAQLMQCIRDPNMMHTFWLEIFNKLIQDNHEISTSFVEATDWAEIDFHPDIESLQKAITANIF